MASVKGGEVVVPQPPRLLVAKPRHDRCVATLAVGTEAVACVNAGRAHFEHYARQHDADFVVLNWPGHPGWSMSAKFGIPRLLDYYQQVAYFDADILLRNGCVDVFALAGDADWAAYDEYNDHMLHTAGQMRMRRFAEESSREVTQYFNCGVQVMRKGARKALLPPKHPLLTTHLGEQEWINQAVDGLNIVCLPRTANWQNWYDPGFRKAPKDAVLHWSGGGVLRHNRAGQIVQMAGMSRAPAYAEPWKPKASVLSHHFYADERHVQWIHRELLSRKRRRVLEIGCFHGYSTSAFIDAFNRGYIEELHLCDTLVLPQLHALLKPGVIMHQERSVTLLVRDRDWDLVYVDGDHSLENVVAETKLLLGCPAVFAHDTQGLFRCPGPPKLKEAFLADPRYRCWEDAERRPGERTERGMFFAEM